MGQGESRQRFEKELNEVRRQEQERAATELNNAIGKTQSQFQQELKKLSDANLKREKEQQEVINKLQQQENECSLPVESLGSNMQAEELEDDIQRLRKELGSEKAEREEALARISALELVIDATTNDLGLERQRLKSARKKIMNLEKQLLAFCTTTEKMKHVFDKQQEKLEAMHKASQETENDQINASIEADPNHQIAEYNVGTTIVKETETEEIKHVFDKQQEKLEEAMHKASQEKENDQINASTEADPNHQIAEYNVGTTIVKETETEEIKHVFDKQQEKLEEAMHKASQEKENDQINASIEADPNHQIAEYNVGTTIVKETETEEINHVFDKQQEKLEEVMHKASQEKENDQINASIEADPNHQIAEYNVGTTIVKETETTSHTSNGTMEPNSTSSVEREGNNVGVEASSDDDNVRETHDRV